MPLHRLCLLWIWERQNVVLDKSEPSTKLFKVLPIVKQNLLCRRAVLRGKRKVDQKLKYSVLVCPFSLRFLQ